MVPSLGLRFQLMWNGCVPKFLLIAPHATIAYALDRFASDGIFTQNTTVCGDVADIPGNVALAKRRPSKLSALPSWPGASAAPAADSGAMFIRADSGSSVIPDTVGMSPSPRAVWSPTLSKDQCAYPVGAMKCSS